MSETAAPAGAGRGFSRCLLVAAVILAVIAVVSLAVGPIGWRAGWWHFRVAFGWMMPTAFYTGAAAVVASVLAFVLGWRGFSGRRRVVAAGALLVGAAIASVPWGYNQMRGMLPNDITTDLDNPPPYVAVLPIRKATSAPNDGEYKPQKAE